MESLTQNEKKSDQINFSLPVQMENSNDNLSDENTAEEECNPDHSTDEESNHDDGDDEYYHNPGSDDDELNCPICLNDFEEQQIGVPNNCQHLFCADCILEWSKIANSCPVDRIKFQSVLVYHEVYGLFNREISIKEAKIAEDYEEETLCQICGRGDNEETLLLCDGCDLAFHCACLNPPLDAVPAGEWFCPRCQEERGEASSDTQTRVVGRTYLSERVRRRVTETRQRQMENYSNLDEQLDAIIDEILRTANQRFLETESSIYKRKQLSTKPLKRRSSHRRKRAAKRKKRSKSNKSKSLNDPKKPSSMSKEDLKIRQNFSLTGKSNDLNAFSSKTSNSSEVPSHVIAKRHRLLTQSAIMYNTPLPSLFSLHAESSAYPPMSPPPPMPDILSSILSNQEFLFTSSSEITIKRNGDLESKKTIFPPSSKSKIVSATKETKVEAIAEANTQGTNTSKIEENLTSQEVEEVSGVGEKSKLQLLNEDIKKSSVEQNSNTQTGFLSRTSMTSNTAKPSILIKPIFSLPKPKKVGAGDEGGEGWQESSDKVSKEEVYDPFRPTESDDDAEVITEETVVEKETEAKISDEGSPISPESSPEPSPIEKKVPDDSLTKASAAKSALEDEFEIDIFAEQELEKAQAEASRRVSESLLPDPLKMWRDETRPTSVTDDPLIILPTLQIQDSVNEPMKFKKISRKDRNSVPETDGPIKSHYRTNKVIPKKERKVNKEKEKRSKDKLLSKSSPVERFKKYSESDMSDSSDHYERRKSRRRSPSYDDVKKKSKYRIERVVSPARYDSNRQLLFKRKKSPFGDINSTRFARDKASLYRVDIPSADAKITKRKVPFENEEVLEKKRKSDEGFQNREAKRNSFEAKEKKKKKQRDHSIDDDVLWSLNPKPGSPPPDRFENDLQINYSPIRKTSRKKQKDSPSPIKRAPSSSEKEKKKKRKKRKKVSSESEEDVVHKKKNKKKGYLRSRSRSTSEEKKLKKKKKKRFKSPKKKTSNHKSSVKKIDFSAEPGKLSFEHIFAEFDDIKKGKTKNSNDYGTEEAIHRFDDDEEETSVVYEYESLSEGEILSSDDGTKKKNIQSVVQNPMQTALANETNKQALVDKTVRKKMNSIHSDQSSVPVVAKQIQDKQNSLHKEHTDIDVEYLLDKSLVNAPLSYAKKQSSSDSELAGSDHPIEEQVLIVESNLFVPETSSLNSALKMTQNFAKEKSIEVESNPRIDEVTSNFSVTYPTIFSAPFILPSSATKDALPGNIQDSVSPSKNNAVAPVVSDVSSFEPVPATLMDTAKSVQEEKLPVSSTDKGTSAMKEVLPTIAKDGSSSAAEDILPSVSNIESLATKDKLKESPISLEGPLSPVSMKSNETESRLLVIESDVRDKHMEEEDISSKSDHEVETDVKSTFISPSSPRVVAQIISQSPSSLKKQTSEIQQETDIRPLLKYLQSLKGKESSSNVPTQQPPDPPMSDSQLSNSQNDFHSDFQSESVHSDVEMRHHDRNVVKTVSDVTNVSVKLTTADHFDNNSKNVSISNQTDKKKEKSKRKQSIERKSSHEEQAKDFDPFVTSLTSTKEIPMQDIQPSTVTSKGSDLYSPSYPILSPASPKESKPANQKSISKPALSTISSTSVNEKVVRYLKERAKAVESEKKKSSKTSGHRSSVDAKEPASNPKDLASLKFDAQILSSLYSTSQNEQISVEQATNHPGKYGMKSKPVVEGFDREKKKMKHQEFQQRVVKLAKNAIMPYFKRREVSKEQYKGIMKKAVNKICRDNKDKQTLDSEKVGKLIKKYVESCLEINEKNREKMRMVLNRKVDKHIRRKKNDLDFSTSPPSPVDNSPSKDIPEQMASLMYAPIPPPPFPPSNFSSKR